MDEDRLWEVVAGVLAAAAALLVAGTVLEAFGFGPSGNTRQRLEAAAQGANPLFALFALLAIALVYWLNVDAESPSQLRRWVVWVAMAAALAVTVGAGYSIWDVLTISIGRNGSIPPGGSGWAVRLATVLARLAALFPAVVGLLLGARPRILKWRPTRTRVPLRTRDWRDPWDDGDATKAAE